MKINLTFCDILVTKEFPTKRIKRYAQFEFFGLVLKKDRLRPWKLK